MGDSDTATIDLSKGEAREIINALSDYQFRVSGQDERRALDVREFLQREFDFEDSHFETGDGDLSIMDGIGDVFEDHGDHEIQLSRAEAEEIVPALDDAEGDTTRETETIAQLKDRIERAFDLGTDYAR